VHELYSTAQRSTNMIIESCYYGIFVEKVDHAAEFALVNIGDTIGTRKLH